MQLQFSLCGALNSAYAHTTTHICIFQAFVGANGVVSINFGLPVKYRTCSTFISEEMKEHRKCMGYWALFRLYRTKNSSKTANFAVLELFSVLCSWKSFFARFNLSGKSFFKNFSSKTMQVRKIWRTTHFCRPFLHLLLKSITCCWRAYDFENR